MLVHTVRSFIVNINLNNIRERSLINVKFAENASHLTLISEHICERTQVKNLIFVIFQDVLSVLPNQVI